MALHENRKAAIAALEELKSALDYKMGQRENIADRYNRDSKTFDQRVSHVVEAQDALLQNVIKHIQAIMDDHLERHGLTHGTADDLSNEDADTLAGYYKDIKDKADSFALSVRLLPELLPEMVGAPDNVSHWLKEWNVNVIRSEALKMKDLTEVLQKAKQFRDEHPKVVRQGKNKKILDESSSRSVSPSDDHDHAVSAPRVTPETSAHMAQQLTRARSTSASGAGSLNIPQDTRPRSASASSPKKGALSNVTIAVPVITVTEPTPQGNTKRLPDNAGASSSAVLAFSHASDFIGTHSQAEQPLMALNKKSIRQAMLGEGFQKIIDAEKKEESILTPKQSDVFYEYMDIVAKVSGHHDADPSTPIGTLTVLKDKEVSADDVSALKTAIDAFRHVAITRILKGDPDEQKGAYDNAQKELEKRVDEMINKYSPKAPGLNNN